MKEEKKDKKKKSIVLIIAAVAILLVAIAGATYAYFTASGGSTENSLVNVTTENVDAVSCTSADVSLIVKAEDMAVSAGTAGGTAINPSNSTSNEDANGTITCTAVKNSGSPTTCTYDIVYTPAQGKAFTTYSAANTGSLQELTLQGSSSTTTGTIASGKTAYAETDMYTMQSQTTLISSGLWSFSAAGSMTYTFTPTFYNYNFEQKDLANSSWGGTISVANLSCGADSASPAPAEQLQDVYVVTDQAYAIHEGEQINLDSQYIHDNAADALADWSEISSAYISNTPPFYLKLKVGSQTNWTIYYEYGGYQGETPYDSCTDTYNNVCYASEAACNAALAQHIANADVADNGIFDSNYTCQVKGTVNNVVKESYVEFIVSNEMATNNSGMVAGTYSLKAASLYDSNSSCKPEFYDSVNEICASTYHPTNITTMETAYTAARCNNDTEQGEATCGNSSTGWVAYSWRDGEVGVKNSVSSSVHAKCSISNGYAQCSTD